MTTMMITGMVENIISEITWPVLELNRAQMSSFFNYKRDNYNNAAYNNAAFTNNKRAGGGGGTEYI